MLVRIWTTGLVEGREREYEIYARDYSIPMFQKQPGLLGVTLLIRHTTSHVLTYWKNREDILKMEADPLYKATVEDIQEKGFLVSPQRIRIYHAPIHYSASMIAPNVYAFRKYCNNKLGKMMDKYLEEFSEQITFHFSDDLKW